VRAARVILSLSIRFTALSTVSVIVVPSLNLSDSVSRHTGFSELSPVSLFSRRTTETIMDGHQGTFVADWRRGRTAICSLHPSARLEAGTVAAPVAVTGNADGEGRRSRVNFNDRVCSRQGCQPLPGKKPWARDLKYTQVGRSKREPFWLSGLT
jgi:hypothetical protein